MRKDLTDCNLVKNAKTVSLEFRGIFSYYLRDVS